MIANRGHSCSVCDENVFTSMNLAVFIDDGIFWVCTHAAAAHFVNIKAGILLRVKHINVFTTRFFEHFGGLRLKISHHFMVIFIIINRSNQLRNAPRIFQIFTKANMVACLRYCFALHLNINSPIARIRQRLFKFSPKSILTLTTPITTTSRRKGNHITTQKIGFLFENVSEGRHKSRGWSSSIIIRVLKTCKTCISLTSILMKSNVLPKYARIISQTIRETA